MTCPLCEGALEPNDEAATYECQACREVFAEIDLEGGRV